VRVATVLRGPSLREQRVFLGTKQMAEVLNPKCDDAAISSA
jgi:hypothetical protein